MFCLLRMVLSCKRTNGFIILKLLNQIALRGNAEDGSHIHQLAQGICIGHWIVG